MTAYYNEIDPYAAQWLRNLIKAGHIASGDVDERSIVDVRADDLKRYTQCHFFAGIGGWSIALRLAGWADDRPVWTGSCPCQPFSAAGAGKAGNDERHLWPAWFSLIAKRKPAIVFGEQVEAAVGWGWLDVVFADLEGQGYACGATVLPACGVGAPHIRQRLWFMADARCQQRERRQDKQRPAFAGSGEWNEEGSDHQRSGTVSAVADTNGGDASAERLQRGGQHGQRAQDGIAGELGNAQGNFGRTKQQAERAERAERRRPGPSRAGTPSDQGGGWATPTSRDWKDGAADLSKVPVNALMGRQALLATWPTPRAEDSESSGMSHSRGVADTMTAVASLTASGETPNGSPAQTEKPGRLDPDHSRWVMGYSAEHLSCAPTETPSFLKSRRNLSAPSWSVSHDG